MPGYSKHSFELVDKDRLTRFKEIFRRVQPSPPIENAPHGQKKSSSHGVLFSIYLAIKSYIHTIASVW